jgi:hypothetical protein
MAHCVVSEIYDTDDETFVPACMVHTHNAPCPRDGQPANPNPIHIGDQPSRVEALAMWHQRTGKQRPLVLHRGNIGDVGHTLEASDCPCLPEFFTAKDRP